MGTQEVRRRGQNPVRFTPNGKETEDLNRGFIYRELYLTLNYQPTITAPNNTAAKTKRGDEWAIVKRIDIIANGTETIRSYSGAGLRALQYVWFKNTPRSSPGLGDGATANPQLRSTLVLPFWMPNSIRPIDTALDTRAMSNLSIDVTWGTHTDLNGDASGFTTAPTIEIDTLESFGIQGPFSQWRQWEISTTITSDNNRFQLQLPVGSMYRGLYIVGTDGGVEQDDIINRVKLVSGTTVFADGSFRNIRDAVNLRNEREYNVQNVGTANNILAYLDLEQVTDGFNSESIDTLGLAEFVLEMDVTKGAGTTDIHVIPSTIIPVRTK